MKQILLGACVATLLAACGGDGTNPFMDADNTTDGDSTDSTVPQNIQNNLGSYTFDPVNQTLSITGVPLDGEPLTAVYTRDATLDRDGYLGFVTQESSLDRFTIAYVKDVNGTNAGVAVTGGQFGYYFGGALYGSDGDFTPPAVTSTTGLASYAGTYVGVTNLQSGTTGLFPTTALPAGFTPTRPATVSGQVLINADFADNRVNGGITNRVINDNGLAISDVELAPTDINADGSFSGDTTQNLQSRGSYAGIFGGSGATEVAGALYMEDHITSGGISDAEEYGIFVLIQCGQPGEDALCNQPVR
jgi:hypothetical protein